MNRESEQFTQAIRLHQQRKLTDAEALYRQVLEQNPEHAGALHLLGVLAHQKGSHEDAVDLILRGIALRPNQATYHSNLGVALLALGRLEESASSLQTAIGLSPDLADAYANLGLVLQLRGQPQQARASFEAALRLQPDHVDALFNLGNLHQELGQPELAVPLYERAHRAAPRRLDVFNNLGNAQLACEQFEPAIVAYRRATELDPGFTDAWLNLATALERQDRHAEAAACLARVAETRPVERLLDLRRAALCPAVFPSTQAIAVYRTALESTLDRLEGADFSWDQDEVAGAACCPSFNMAHHGGDDRRLRTKFAAVFRPPAPRPAPRARSEKPRIGFVVTDRHEGSFLRCCAGLLNQFTPGRFAIVVFGSPRRLLGLERAIQHPDARFQALPHRFTQAAEAIRSADCDLLYHWEVGTDALNYALPFARLAPVQCTSWGVQITTGVPAIDYYISSSFVEFEEADAHYSERLVRLPCLLSYQMRTPRPNPPVDRAEFGLPRSAHVYACLQRPLKLHPGFDGLLSEILRRDPQGLLLLLKWPTGVAHAQVAERHRATMPDVVDRIVWLPWQEARTYHRVLSLADVVLDPVPYGSGSSAYDAFAHDLPVVTLPGRYNAGRYVQACYRRMGFLELVAETPEEYVDVAMRLGTQTEFRAEIRAKIARAAAVLFEDTNVVREHEDFFERAIAESRST